MLVPKKNVSELYRPFEEIQKEIDKLFSEAFRGLDVRRGEYGMLIPEVDIYETDDAIFVEMEVPGIKKKDLEIKIEDGILTIKGEKSSEKDNKSRNYHLYERSYGMFQRAFRLPDSIDTTKVKAKYEDGVLKIELPKKEEVKKETVSVKVE